MTNNPKLAKTINSNTSLNKFIKNLGLPIKNRTRAIVITVIGVNSDIVDKTFAKSITNNAP